MFPFLLSLFHIDLCSMFFVFFRVLKNWFLILFHSPFKNSSFEFVFYVSKINKMLLLSWKKRWKKLYFLFLISGFKKHLRGKNPFCFSLFLNFLFVISSLFASKPQKKSDKTLHFCFWSVTFCFIFFNIFLFSLPSLLSLFTFPFHLFVHLFLLSSLFLSPLFSILSFFCISCFLICFFSIAVFAYPHFVLTHFSSVSFVLDLILLFFLLLLFFFISVSVLLPKQIQKKSVVNFFWRRNRVFDFWTLFSSVFGLVFFSSLRRPLLVFRVSWYSFSWFSCVNLLFGSGTKKLSFCCWTEVAKKKVLFERDPCFSFLLNIFAVDLFFHAWSSKNILPLFFQWLWTISCFFSFCSKKSPQFFWFSLFYVYSPWCYSSYSPRFSFVFLFLLPCVLSLCLLSLCSFTLFVIFLFSLSLFLMLLLFNSFFNHICFSFFFLKKISFFDLFTAFCETVFVLSPLLFRLFSCCSFQSCSFEQDKLSPFLLAEKPLFNPSKNLFAQFLPFDVKKYFIVFLFFFFDSCLCNVLKVCFMQHKIVFNILNFLQ